MDILNMGLQGQTNTGRPVSMAPENFYLAPEFMCFILIWFMVF
jgi:hypothetical protein